MDKNGMNNEHLRCFGPYFPPFVIKYPYGSYVGFCVPITVHTHVWGLGWYCMHLNDNNYLSHLTTLFALLRVLSLYVKYDTMCIRMG